MQEAIDFIDEDQLESYSIVNEKTEEPSNTLSSQLEIKDRVDVSKKSSRRDQMAASIMAGCISNSGLEFDYEGMCRHVVTLTDTLLKKLDE